MSLSSLAPGMSTFIWGPLFWSVMTDLAIRMDQVPFDSRNNEIWTTLRLMLPCKWCRQSYRKFIRIDPPTRPYKTWLYELRNKVNLKLEKPAFELDKFKRRCHVYTSFSNVSTWWDIHFILALNYDHTRKRSAYTKWFRLWSLMFNFLPYSIPHEPIPKSALASKFSLLLWLTRLYNQTNATDVSVEFFARKYSQAIAHKTPEELYQLCGPLILRCKNYSTRMKNKNM